MPAESQTRRGASGVWPQLDDPRLAVFLHHWAARRAGLRMPRDSIDPAALRGCLPHVWIYRCMPDTELFVCTLAGEAVQEAWGHSIIGRRLEEFNRPQDAAMLEARYREVLDMPAVQHSRRSITPAGQMERRAERLIVPLSDADGRPYGVFGISLYRFDPVAATGKPVVLNAEAVVYACADLPADLPPVPSSA